MKSISQKEKARIIAQIEYPSLAITVGEGMTRKGLPYRLETVGDRNILTVHIVDYHFFQIPVTLDNVERVLGLMQYFLMRPEKAREELPSIRIVADWHLAQSWPAAQR